MNQFKLRATVAAVAGVALFGLAAGAKADSTDDLLKKLRDKGVLSEQEYDEFNNTRDTEKAKKNSEIKASFKDGISWTSGDKQHSIALNGRVQLDYRNFSDEDSTKQADTFDIRRAYLGAKGTFFGNYDFEVTYNGAGAATSDLYQAWLNARYWDAVQFKFGQYKQPMGLEELGSSRFINFTERSMLSSLVPGVDRGVQVHGEPMKGLTYAVGVFNGIDVNKGQNTNETMSAFAGGDGKSVTGRVTANIAEFMGNKEAVFHLGAAYSRNNENSGANQVSIGSEGRGTDVFKINAFTALSATNNGYDLNRKALEAAVAYGPFKFQSEYLNAEFEPDGNTRLVTGAVAGDSYDIKAWYASVSWMITGENYADTYKNGMFGGRTKPKNEFIAPGAPGWGAWEIGARYSKLDASDFESAQTATVYNVTTTPATVGEFNEADSWTVGLKWIPNPNVRYLLNYVKTDLDCVTGVVCTNDEEKALNLRAQIDF